MLYRLIFFYKVKNELHLRNKLYKSINVEVRRILLGEIRETSPNAEDVKTAKGLYQVDPKHVLTWELERESGEEQKMTFLYQVYIRN